METMKHATAIDGEEAVILNRLIKPDAKLRPAAASAFLELDFDDRDRARMHELAVKNQANELTPEEEAELRSYLKVGLFVDLIHAKARRSLQTSPRRR
jgi:hypothetical protein